MPLLIIGALILLPLIFSFVLRVNAGILFLALCAGSVVSQFVGADTIQLVDSFFPRSSSTLTASVTHLVLLLLPAVMTIIFMRRSITGPKTFVNLFPAIASGLLAALLAVPLIPPGTRGNIMSSQVWSILEQFQTLIIGAGAFVSLLVMWGSKPKHDKKKKHK